MLLQASAFDRRRISSITHHQALARSRELIGGTVAWGVVFAFALAGVGSVLTGLIMAGTWLSAHTGAHYYAYKDWDASWPIGFSIAAAAYTLMMGILVYRRHIVGVVLPTSKS